MFFNDNTMEKHLSLMIINFEDRLIKSMHKKNIKKHEKIYLYY